MPTITGQDILNKVKIILQDANYVHWTEAELLGWLNDAQRAVCAAYNRAKYVVDTIPLVAGSLQQLPAGATALFRIIRNANGPVVTKVPQYQLDTINSRWYSSQGTREIVHYAYDETSPKHFFVYPPAAASGAAVVAHYGGTPTDLSTPASTIDVDDIYAPALVHYVCYMAFLKDMEAAGDDVRAKMHLDGFTSFMAAKAAADQGTESTTVENYRR